MAETYTLKLPLVAPAQAQKHVTVNEALSRLDGVVQMVLEEIDQANPPAEVAGAFSIGAGATGDWFGQDGRIAIASNEGWDFVTPEKGWSAFVKSTGAYAIFDGASWFANAQTLTANGAGIALETVEVDHDIETGATSSTGPIIPANSVVFGVTGRVLETISGTNTSFSVGVASESIDRYGSGYGLAQGSFVRGITSGPLAYYADTSLDLTADTGAFAGGVIRLCVHFLTLRIPAI